jgi:hypothetical protein
MFDDYIEETNDVEIEYHTPQNKFFVSIYGHLANEKFWLTREQLETLHEATSRALAFDYAEYKNGVLM